MHPFTTAVVAQVDHYFGPNNLPRDHYLQSLMHPHMGWVPLAEIVKFKRMIGLGATHIPTVAQALRHSAVVEVDLSGQFVRPRHYTLTFHFPQVFPVVPSVSVPTPQPTDHAPAILPFVYSPCVPPAVSTPYAPASSPPYYPCTSIVPHVPTAHPRHLHMGCTLPLSHTPMPYSMYATQATSPASHTDNGAVQMPLRDKGCAQMQPCAKACEQVVAQDKEKVFRDVTKYGSDAETKEQRKEDLKDAVVKVTAINVTVKAANGDVSITARANAAGNAHDEDTENVGVKALGPRRDTPEASDVSPPFSPSATRVRRKQGKKMNEVQSGMIRATSREGRKTLAGRDFAARKCPSDLSTETLSDGPARGEQARARRRWMKVGLGETEFPPLSNKGSAVKRHVRAGRTEVVTDPGETEFPPLPSKRSARGGQVRTRRRWVTVDLSETELPPLTSKKCERVEGRN